MNKAGLQDVFPVVIVEGESMGSVTHGNRHHCNKMAKFK